MMSASVTSIQRAKLVTLRKHTPFLIVLLFSFVLRLLLADWNSYWLDELLSVKTYGIDHANLFGMIDELAESSIHPPLYQSILFFWMQLFGHGEVVTRLLSNLYVVGATVLLYLVTWRVFSRRIAFFTVLLFVLAHDPISFGLETRSYAQTLFLSTLSTYLLYRLLTSDRRPLHNPAWWLLCLVNLGLLLTHYYNGVFIGVQSAFILLYDSHRKQRLAPFRAISTTLIPLGVFLILWGQQMLARTNNPLTDTHIETLDPVWIFTKITFLNVNPFLLLLYPLIAIALAGAVLHHARLLLRQRDVKMRQYFQVYLLLMVLLIPVGAYIMTGFGKFIWRYIIYFIPPLMVLVVLMIEAGLALIDRLVRFRLSRFYVRNAGWIAALVAVVLVLPAGYQAATKRKSDWRGLSQTVVQVIQQNPDADYVVYATDYLGIYDYYFTQWGAEIDLRPISRQETWTQADYQRRFDVDTLATVDYIILLFIHDAPMHYNLLLQRLCQEHQFILSTLADGGDEGYVLFKPGVDDSTACPATLR
jgi:uncharacterized membrane protein